MKSFLFVFTTRKGYKNQNRFQFSSVAQSCPTLGDPLDCSMSGFPVYHQLLELTETHVHRLGDAIQPSHPLSSPSPPAFNLSQHQGLFQSVSSSHQVTSFFTRKLLFTFTLLPFTEHRDRKVHFALDTGNTRQLVS